MRVEGEGEGKANPSPNLSTAPYAQLEQYADASAAVQVAHEA